MTWNKNVCLLSWLTASVLLVVEGKWRKWEQGLEFQAGMFDHKIEQSYWGMFFRGPRIITRQTHTREAPLIHAILVFSRRLKPFLERCTHVHVCTHTHLSLKGIALLGCSCSDSRHWTTLVQVGCWCCTAKVSSASCIRDAVPLTQTCCLCPVRLSLLFAWRVKTRASDL